MSYGRWQIQPHWQAESQSHSGLQAVPGAAGRPGPPYPYCWARARRSSRSPAPAAAARAPGPAAGAGTSLSHRRSRVAGPGCGPPPGCSDMASVAISVTGGMGRADQVIRAGGCSPRPARVVPGPAQARRWQPVTVTAARATVTAAAL